jgi:hypothetical protein
MPVWLVLLLGSALIGVICAALSPKKRAFLFAALVPWLALLAVLLYNEYFMPYEGGGASMWPIAQLFGGTAATIAGLAGALATRLVQRRRVR